MEDLSVAYSMNRLLSVVLVLVWLAPSVGAVGLGLHVAFEHDGAHASEHQAEIAELAMAAAQVHHHDFGTAPHHHHSARLEATTPLVKAGPSLLSTVPATPIRLTAPIARARLDRAPRRGPPRPLFTTFCSLLL